VVTSIDCDSWQHTRSSRVTALSSTFDHRVHKAPSAPPTSLPRQRSPRRASCLHVRSLPTCGGTDTHTVFYMFAPEIKTRIDTRYNDQLNARARNTDLANMLTAHGHTVTDSTNPGGRYRHHLSEHTPPTNVTHDRVSLLPETAHMHQPNYTASYRHTTTALEPPHLTSTLTPPIHNSKWRGWRVE
jgi:hypothetical protein